MHTAYIGLGSNMGNREENLHRALDLMVVSGMSIEATSSIYETEPQGVEDQPWFLNMVVRVKTGYGPHDLLQLLLGIERRMGRKRVLRWGPRVIDLDILLYDQQEIWDEDLQVPHPRIAERAFVLVPLLEIAPDISLPDGTFLKDSLLQPGIKAQKVRRFVGDGEN